MTRWSMRLAAVLCAALAIVLAIISPDPFRVAVDRALNRMGMDRATIHVYYNKEGAAATTTATGIGDDLKTKRLLVNGIGMSNLCIETKLIAHLPLMLHPNPKDVLVICFGMGTTARSVRVHKDVECDVVELVPQVYECFKYFHDDANEVMADARLHCYADDGRNFLLVRRKKYDVINIDPAPPVWSAGTVNLYTKEFFELCKERLNDEGILCLWVPSVQASEMRLIMKTFHSVFLNAQMWHGPRSKQSGVFLMGFRNPGGSAQEGFRRLSDAQEVLADLNEFKFEPQVSSLESLREFRSMNSQQLADFVGGVPVISDDRPYTEFPLWRSIFDPEFRRRLVVP